MICLFSCLSAQDGHRNFAVTTGRNASYPGGDSAFAYYVYSSIQLSPEATAKKITGAIQVGFMVLPDSTTSDVRALNDLGYGTKQEAERIIRQARFSPALQNGKAIKQQMMIAVNF